MHSHGREKNIREQKKHPMFLKISVPISLAKANDMTKPDDVGVG